MFEVVVGRWFEEMMLRCFWRVDVGGSRRFVFGVVLVLLKGVWFFLRRGGFWRLGRVSGSEWRVGRCVGWVGVGEYRGRCLVGLLGVCFGGSMRIGVWFL